MIRALLVVVSVAGCGTPEPAGSPPRIIELSASVEPLRREFEAHRGEPRFLTLLAPS